MTSTSTSTTVSTFPTGERSPYTGGYNYAFVVYPYGHVDGDDDGGGYLYGSSYGLNSPGTVTNLDAFITTTTGDVDHAGNTSIYTYSYGNVI